MELADRLRHLLGPGFSRPGLGAVARVGQADCCGWRLEKLRFEGRDGEQVSASFLHPPDGHPPVPAVIYAHAHGNRYHMGCEELTEGRPALQGPYAPDLVRLGIAALCIEMPCFGARQQPGESARAKAALWKGETLWGQMLAEQIAGVDFLAAHPAIRPDGIGALGFSMGSTLAFWLAALDARVRACAAQCSLADLETLIGKGAHDGHGIYMTVPGVLPVARTGQIAGLIAPRALHVSVGLQDWSTPKAAFDVARQDLETAFATGGQLSLHVEPDTGHEETPAMRRAVLAFLSSELAG